MSSFDLPGVLRRIRRSADLSQRELAEHVGMSKSAIAAAESGASGLDARVVARAAALARLRLELVDEQGRPVAAMAATGARDRAHRHFPAHLDTRYGDEAWWHGRERYARAQPWYTFDRLRDTRDYWRGRIGTPDDHLVPGPGDSPQERAAARRRAARQRQDEEHRRRLATGELTPPEPFVCTCPPVCDELDDRSGAPVHADGCPCGCDVA